MDAIYRSESRRILATLIRLLGDFDLAEDALHDAFPQIWALAASGKLRVDTERFPLADVEAAWQRHDTPGRRLVITP